MKLAISSVESALKQFESAPTGQKMLIAYEFFANELPIVLEEMIEAQRKLDGGNGYGPETGDR